MQSITAVPALLAMRFFPFVVFPLLVAVGQMVVRHAVRRKATRPSS